MKQLINQITELLSDNNLIIKSDEYAKNENSAYTNDYYGYFNGAKDMGETILQKIKDHSEKK
jgi:hypothetical protein